MKKSISMVLSTTMIATMVTGCGGGSTSATTATTAGQAATEAVVSENFNATGMPIVNESITFEIAAQSLHNKNFEELQFFQELEEETNIDVEWIMSSTEAWQEKKSLLFTGNDLPDAFYGQAILTDVEVVRYGAQGLLIPLNDLIDEYCPNLQALFEWDPEYRKLITAPDGNIYALPSLTELSPTTHDKLFINREWLDTLGLEVPTTTEEFREVLKAFKTGDPNGNGKADEIPFSFLSSKKENGLHSMFGSFGQVDNLDNFIVKDGQVVYTAQTEPYKEAIQYFHSLYEDGVVDPEAFTHDSSVYNAKIRSEELSVGVFVGWSLSSTAQNNKPYYEVMAPLEGPDGDQMWKTFTSSMNAKGSFAITNSCENPEALMRWIDTHYDPEVSLQLDQGLLGITIEKTEEGKYVYLPTPEGNSFTEMIHNYSPGVNGVGAVTMAVAKDLELNENLTERAALDEFYAPYNVPADEVYPSVYFTEDEVEEVAILQTDIASYVSQQYAKWIVEGGVEEEWDKYLKQLEAMDVDSYIKIYQDAYERYTSS